MISLTAHAKQRIKERDFSMEDLAFARQFGRVIRKGARILWCLGKFDNNSGEKLPFRLRGLMVVTPADNTGLVVTAYRCNWKKRYLS